MGISFVTQASGLSPGSDLWVIPNLKESAWSSRINWYLNFLLTRSDLRVPKSLSDNLRSVLAETEMYKHNSSEGSSLRDELLIASHIYLPNQWTLVRTQWDNVNTACQSIVSVSRQLKSNQIRVFLPQGLNSTDFAKAWQVVSVESQIDLQIVGESVQ